LKADIAKQAMRNYLLGTLNAERRTLLEESLLSDPEVYEELLVVEEELIDQYVAGALSKEEQHRFESNFLITAGRQKNLRFGRLLKRYLNSQPVLVSDVNLSGAVDQAGKTAPAKRSVSSYFGPFHTGPALAFAASITVCLGIIFFLCWYAARKPAPNIAQVNSQNLMVVTLTPGSTRSSGATRRVTVPPRGVDVKLELELANPSFHNYKSQLFRENEPLQTLDKLRMEAKGDRHIVPLTITGETLSPGDYQVRLSGILDSGEDEFIDNYSFRVITE
jgi:hypothetical protein